jgi:hypothetical protein
MVLTIYQMLQVILFTRVAVILVNINAVTLLTLLICAA